MITIPAITLWQPWATWIAEGLKTIETRGHERFAGLAGKTIAIHAGLQWDNQAFMLASRHVEQMRLGWKRDMPRGAVVCLADVTGRGQLNRSHEPQALCPCYGRFGLFLKNVRRLDKPIPALGHQGIWSWSVPPGLALVFGLKSEGRP
jgi:hypothetical protein